MAFLVEGYSLKVDWYQEWDIRPAMHWFITTQAQTSNMLEWLVPRTRRRTE